MYYDYQAWRAVAIAMGYSVEADGSGKVVAHSDGDERGVYGMYGGVLTGWYY